MYVVQFIFVRNAFSKKTRKVLHTVLWARLGKNCFDLLYFDSLCFIYFSDDT